MHKISLLCDTEMCNLGGKTSWNPWGIFDLFLKANKIEHLNRSTMDKTGKSWHKGLFGVTQQEKRL